MKKIKKILLAFAPLTAIAVATPIVLTACSDTTTNTTPGGGNGGNNGGGSTETVKPSFTADNTNSDSFELDTTSEAQKILDNYKKAQGEEAATKILDDSLKGFPKKDSGNLVQDVLNMWSNNNWFTITKTAKDENVKKTFISNLTINEAKVDATTGKASFNVEYKNAFTDNKNRVIEATQVLKASEIVVDANTPSIEIAKEVPKTYKIDGKEQPLSVATLLETSDEIAKNNFENVLKQSKVTIDAKQVFQSFITNHNIKHAEKPATPNLTIPVWNETRVKTKKGLSIDSTNNKNVILQLSATANTDWGSISEAHEYETIKTAVFTNRLTEIKKLVDFNDYKDWNTSMGAEVKDANNKSHAIITINFVKKDDVQGNDTSPIFTFTIKGFKSSAN